jgi:hypothetical protein
MTKKDFACLGGVVVAGAAGGFGFWLLGEWANTPMFTGFNRYGQICALMFIGALAAAIGVYLLTASDLTSMRTYIFALVCGLVWQPITDAGKRLVTNAAVSNKVARVDISVDRLSSAAHSGGPEVDAQIKDILPSVKAVLQAAPSVQDSSKQEDIAKSSERAINAISGAAWQAPNTSLEALTDISLEAGRAGQSNVAVKAVQGVRTIGFSAAESDNHLLAADAAKSLRAISAQSWDPTVKAAADNSAASIQMKASELAEKK